jgi:hypothetical protein
VRYDRELGALVVRLPNSEQEFLVDPATVRRNDQSAASINEWTGERTLRCVLWCLLDAARGLGDVGVCSMLAVALCGRRRLLPADRRQAGYCLPCRRGEAR